jgi:chromosomal replication initiation ATPase DnaA
MVYDGNGVMPKGINYFVIPAIRKNAVEPTFEDIEKATCEAFGITREDLISDSRNHMKNVYPKYVFSVLALEFKMTVLKDVGKQINRDHASIVHYRKKHNWHLETNYSKYLNRYFDARKRLIDILRNRTSGNPKE